MNQEYGNQSKKFKFFLVNLINKFTIRFVSIGYLTKVEIPLIRLGSAYGGWWVPQDILLKSFNNPYLVSIGLGHDVTFDLECLNLGFDLVGLDPLESSINHANEVLDKFQNKTLMCKGIWKTSGSVKFYQPLNINHDSWSIINSQHTDCQNAREFKVINFKDLLEHIPLISKSDFTILKMDIEGAEYEVLKNFDFKIFKPNYLAIEIDYLSSIKFRSIGKRFIRAVQVRAMLSYLKQNGYQLVKFENYNFFLIRS